MRADFYDHPDLYDALVPIGAHLPFYLELARDSGGSVLELAVGTGLLAVPIAATGCPTCGLDSSAAMLAAARKRATAAGVSVELVEGDMRAFDLGRRFGFVFLARNSLLHITATADLLATFACVRRHLDAGGVFAFDVFNPDVRILARPAGQRFPVRTVTTEKFGPLTVDGSHDYDAAEQVDRGAWYISTPDEKDKWVVSLPVRSLFPQELPLLLERASLRLVKRYGDESKAPFEARSPRQVCVCVAA